MTDRFLAALERKTVSDTGPGEIEGLASTYGNVDLQDDEMQPGALDRTVADWRSARAKVPLLDWHGDSLSRLIGSVTALESVPQGLWFRAAFGSDPESQRARQLAREGHLSGVSIGYLPVRQSFKQVGGRTVRALHEVKLLEISLTPVPANPEAQLTSVKSLGGGAVATAGDVEAELRELEEWAERCKADGAREDMAYLVNHPEVMSHIAGVLTEAEARSQLADLERWAARQPPADPAAEEEAVRRSRWEAANEYSYALMRSMAEARPLR